MEAALALVTLVAVLVVCLAALAAMAAQIRCVDAAREAARLAARGDERAAVAAAYRLAPAAAVVRLRREGRTVEATVTARADHLPGLAISATGIAVAEPGV
ncbi:TadE family type IV pilus minor pilin [Mycolicibacillus trivialis]